MTNISAPSPIREADYEAIESALMQSARGRWFLAKFAEQNRTADTRMLLDAIARLEANIAQPQSPDTSANAMRHTIIEMAEAISQTRREIASMGQSSDQDSQFANATEELDAIVASTEKATSDILEAAEDMQETAWLMREQGAEAEACDKLDARATDIYTACSFQDLTGQRISKVVSVLGYLENRVRSIIDIWGLDDIELPGKAEEDERPDAHLLNGPAREGEGVDQSDVDQMLDAEFPTAAETPVFDNVAEPATEAVSEAATVVEAAPIEDEEPLSNDLSGEIAADDFAQLDDIDVTAMDDTKAQALCN